VKLLIIALVLLPTSCQARCFSIWHYPWAQKCGLHQSSSKLIRAREHPQIIQEQKEEMPLPDLTSIDWGEEGPERLRGIALLRALADVPPSAGDNVPH